MDAPHVIFIAGKQTNSFFVPSPAKPDYLNGWKQIHIYSFLLAVDWDFSVKIRPNLIAAYPSYH